jgi:hypothetical protein
MEIVAMEQFKAGLEALGMDTVGYFSGKRSCRGYIHPS